MSSLKTKRIQVGSHATPENNFGIVQPDTPDGTLRVGRGNLGSLTELLKLDDSALDVLTDLQVGGDPIAERGSNSNGEYVRFYDGTQICWGVQAATLSGGAVAEALSPVDFPAAFSSAPSGRGTISQMQGESGGREHVAYHYQGYPRTTSIRFGVVPAAGNANTNANDLEIDWEAIGRWK